MSVRQLVLEFEDEFTMVILTLYLMQTSQFLMFKLTTKYAIYINVLLAKTRKHNNNNNNNNNIGLGESE